MAFKSSCMSSVSSLSSTVIENPISEDYCSIATSSSPLGNVLSATRSGRQFHPPEVFSRENTLVHSPEGSIVASNSLMTSTADFSVQGNQSNFESAHGESSDLVVDSDSQSQTHNSFKTFKSLNLLECNEEPPVSRRDSDVSGQLTSMPNVHRPMISEDPDVAGVQNDDGAATSSPTPLSLEYDRSSKSTYIFDDETNKVNEINQLKDQVKKLTDSISKLEFVM